MSRPGTRVYLSPVEKGDLPFFVEAINNEEISQFLQGHYPTTIQDEENWFDRVSRRKESDSIFSIVLKQTNEAIGVIGLHNIKSIDKTASTGAFIGREDLLNKGLGTEAKMLMLKHAFLELNLRIIISRAYAFNGRSIRYSEKCGYKKIAVYPDFIFRNGKYHDLIHLMVTREMWEPLLEEFEDKMKGEENESE